MVAAGLESCVIRCWVVRTAGLRGVVGVLARCCLVDPGIDSLVEVHVPSVVSKPATTSLDALLDSGGLVGDRGL